MSWPSNDPYPYGSTSGPGQAGGRPPLPGQGSAAPGQQGEALPGPVDQPAWAPAPPPIPQYSPPPPPPIPQYGVAQYGQPAYGHPVYGQPEDRVPMAPQHPSPPVPQAQPRRADWGERVAATGIDFVLVLAATMVVEMLTGWTELLDWMPGLAWVAMWAYFAWLNGSKGQSPGKALTGIKVVRDADGSTLGGPVGLIRAAVLWSLSVVTGGLFFVLAVLWPLGDSKRQALHDKIVSASVVAGEPKKSGKDVFRP